MMTITSSYCPPLSSHNNSCLEQRTQEHDRLLTPLFSTSHLGGFLQAFPQHPAPRVSIGRSGCNAECHPKGLWQAQCHL